MTSNNKCIDNNMLERKKGQKHSSNLKLPK